MKSTKFKGSNAELQAPETMPDVMPLPIFTNGHYCLSRWTLTLWERIVLAVTGKVWLNVIGWTQPPVWLGVVDPRKDYPICPAQILHPAKGFYRLIPKGSNVYECQCGAIFVWVHRHNWKILVNPLKDALDKNLREELGKQKPGSKAYGPAGKAAYKQSEEARIA